MIPWKTRRHLEDHFALHGWKLRTRSIEAYDASAQETVRVGNRFTYRDRQRHEPRVGYFHRESSRMTAIDQDGFILSHFRTDEAYAAE